MAKEYLSSKGIPFEAVDVTASDEVTAAFLARTGALSTPVIEVDGVLVRGWDRGKIERLLNAAGRGAEA